MIVELPDGTEAEFPDDIPEEQIKSVIQKKFSNEQPEMSDTEKLNYITGKGRGGFDTLRDLVEGTLIGLGKGGQTIATALTGGRAPTVDMEKIFSKVGSPKKALESQTAKGIGEILPYAYAGGTSLIGQMLGGGAAGAALTEPGESNMFGLLPEGKIGGAISGALLPAEIMGAGKLIGSGISGLKNLKSIKPIEAEHQKAIEAFRNAKESESLLKQEAKTVTGQSDFPSMEHKLVANKNTLDELNQSLNEDIPTPESLLLDTPEEMQKRFLNSKIEHNTSVKEVENINNEIKSLVNSGSTHDVEVARLTKKDLEELKSAGNKKYDEVEKNVKDQGILLPPSRTLEQINDDLITIVQKEKDNILSSPEAKKLLSELDDLKTSEVIPAHEYLSAIKSVKGYARDAYKKASEVGINEEKRVFFRQQADLASEQLEKMNQILEQNIGKENFAKLQEANSYWRNNIIPLYQEPLYWKILNKEKMSSNMASELRGAPAGSGLDIIRNLIKNNPKSVKHVVGQLHDTNPKLLSNPNELTSEYLNLMPELKNTLGLKKEAELISNKAGERVNLYQTFKDEAEKLNKSYEKKITKKENLTEQKQNLQRTIDLMDQYIPKLKEASENVRSTNKQRLIAKDKLKKAKKKRDSATLKLKIIGGAALAPVAYQSAKKGVSLIGGLFNSE